MPARPTCREDYPHPEVFDGYGEWLRERIRNSTVEYWTDGDQSFGHYPHLVDPDRFVDRLRDFWT